MSRASVWIVPTLCVLVAIAFLVFRQTAPHKSRDDAEPRLGQDARDKVGTKPGLTTMPAGDRPTTGEAQIQDLLRSLAAFDDIGFDALISSSRVHAILCSLEDCVRASPDTVVLLESYISSHPKCRSSLLIIMVLGTVDRGKLLLASRARSTVDPSERLAAMEGLLLRGSSHQPDGRFERRAVWQGRIEALSRLTQAQDNWESIAWTGASRLYRHVFSADTTLENDHVHVILREALGSADAKTIAGVLALLDSQASVPEHIVEPLLDRFGEMRSDALLIGAINVLGKTRAPRATAILLDCFHEEIQANRDDLLRPLAVALARNGGAGGSSTLTDVYAQVSASLHQGKDRILRELIRACFQDVHDGILDDATTPPCAESQRMLPKEVLKYWLVEERDANRRAYLAQQFIMRSPQEREQVSLRVFRDPDEKVRVAAVRALAWSKDSAVIDRLRHHIAADPSHFVRNALATAWDNGPPAEEFPVYSPPK